MREVSTTAYIQFENVEVRHSPVVYGLRGVTLSIDQGDFVFLVGRTGAGKSTLLRLLTREVRESSGRVMLHGRDLKTVTNREIPALRQEMGIVPQDCALLPRKRVWENVSYALRSIGVSRKMARKRVPQVLDQVGMTHRADAFPSELSGGEQQRVAIARALINDPPLLIADEPTGHLDPEVSWEIMELLISLNQRGTTILVASHDMMMVERMDRRVVTLDGGLVVSDQLPKSGPDELPLLHHAVVDIPADDKVEVGVAGEAADAG